MSDNEKIRGRISDGSTGLSKEGFERIGAGLEFGGNIDLSGMNDFTAGDVQIGGVADKIQAMEGGLELDADIGKIDQGMRQIREQQKNAEIQGWIDEAQRLMERNKFREAITPLKKVIKADAASGQGWFMLGYCYFAMQDFPQAREHLRQARAHTQNPKLLPMILMLEVLCQRAEMAAFEKMIEQLIKQNRQAEALALVEQELRAQPNHPMYLYHRCGLLLLSGRAADAKRAAEDALRRVPQGAAPLFQQILAAIASMESQQVYQEIRRAIRSKNFSSAKRLLDSNRSRLSGQKQFDALNIYVSEKQSGGSRGGLFSRKRGGSSLPHELLQQLLMWLLSDELNAGSQALNSGQFAMAHRAFSQGQSLDDRCCIMCFLHGLSLFKLFEQDMNSGNPDLARSLSYMGQAASLLETAVQDRIVAQQAQGLKNVVEKYLGELKKAEQHNRGFQKEAKAIGDLFDEFNTMMANYQQSPISTRSELQSAQQKMRSLKQRTTKLRGKHKRGTEPWTVLGQLEEAVTNVLRQLGG